MGLFPRYAMERTDTEINVWFWPRRGSSVPNDVIGSSSSVNPQNWVSDRNLYYLMRLWTHAPVSIIHRTHLRPLFHLPTVILVLTLTNRKLSSICRFVSLFNSTQNSWQLCWFHVQGGDWAGRAYGQSGCPSSCVGEWFMVHSQTKHLNFLRFCQQQP